jgi:hypothetical protein
VRVGGSGADQDGWETRVGGSMEDTTKEKKFSSTCAKSVMDAASRVDAKRCCYK